uniref:Molecular chaperone HtpG n=1 Tax=Desulfacinum infernum TaxID=35837 RepID=A0A831ZYV8_9BACT
MASAGKITFDIDSLLTSLGKSLYTSPNVALRELLQNAHDGLSLYLRSQKASDRQNFSPEVNITLKGRQMIVQDNGIGMSGKELEEEFACIGRSNKKDLQDIVSGRALGGRIIGQYGIGFLASFLVADRVDVYSRREGEQAFHWWCEGQDTYFLEPCEVEFARGTKVVLTLKHEDLPPAFQDISSLKDLAIHYGSLLPFPIFVHYERINPYSAGWVSKDAFNSMSETDLKEFLQAKFPVEFLDVFRINKTAEHIRHGSVSFRAALFISKVGLEAIFFRGTPLEKAATGVDVYCKGMYVRRTQELMPIWARFVHGVIDFDNLDLSLSREEIVDNELLQTYRSMIELDVAHHLRDLKKTEKLKTIVEIHRSDLIQGLAIMGDKQMARNGDRNTLLDVLVDVLPFETTHGKMTLPEYLRIIREASTRFRECEEKTIYTMKQRTTGAGESILASDMGWPVILTVPVEEKILNDYATLHSDITVKLMSPDDLVRAVRGTDDLDQTTQKNLENLFHYSLRHAGRIQIRVSRFRAGVPALLLLDVSDEQALNIYKQVEELSRDPKLRDDSLLKAFMMMGEQYRSTKGSSYFYVNADNKLIKDMLELFKNDPYADILPLAACTIYNSALLQSAHGTLSPRDADIIVGNFYETLQTVLSMTLEKKRKVLDVNVPGEEASQHLKTFVFCAHSFTSNSVKIAIETVKRTVKDELNWEAVSADEDIKDLSVIDNVRELIRTCQFGVADITRFNPNVMIEIGMLEMLGKPVVKIRDVDDETPLPVDIRGDLYCRYSVSRAGGRLDVGAEFVDELKKHLKTAASKCPGL